MLQTDAPVYRIKPISVDFLLSIGFTNTYCGYSLETYSATFRWIEGSDEFFVCTPGLVEETTIHYCHEVLPLIYKTIDENLRFYVKQFYQLRNEKLKHEQQVSHS